MSYNLGDTVYNTEQGRGVVNRLIPTGSWGNGLPKKDAIGILWDWQSHQNETWSAPKHQGYRYDADDPRLTTEPPD